MSVDNKPAQTPEPIIPKKLAKRIQASSKPFQETDLIVGDGVAELRSTDPVNVVNYFLQTNRSRWAAATFQDVSYDLTRFMEYCEYAGIDDLRTISTRDIEGFKAWRKRDGHISLTTLHGQLANIRVFLRFCERVEIVDSGLADSIDLPELDRSDSVSYVRISEDAAENILEYHDKFEYASRKHAEFALMWSILSRLGGVRSLDLSNYKEDEDGSRYVEFVHSPDQDTPLKNGESEVEGEGGEREVNLPEWVADILDDYIEENRTEHEDEYGRRPLFTTGDGRISRSTLRRDMYRITQPCKYGKSCPNDVDPDDCSAAQQNQYLSRCPFSRSPHPIRRGGIIHQIKEGVTKSTICERADVSRKVLNKHYDLRTKEEARRQRREELKTALDDYEYDDKPQTPTESGSSIESHVPIFRDLRRLPKLVRDTPRKPSNRVVKGSAGFLGYIGMVAIDIGLLLSNLPGLTL